jgi:hypothetical protein
MSGMKNRWTVAFPTDMELEVLAVFGRSRVVRLRNGRMEIRGGEPDERAEAREWASLFCHEALPGAR